ncbi:hypothetical protein VNO77_05728 [Canavalia gladiata]|uniref:Uncharacterized protein n=1 Tax=Canavalia gladiata TaxID=3824 RepID=A0AAN9N0X7_CANGL
MNINESKSKKAEAPSPLCNCVLPTQQRTQALKSNMGSSTTRTGFRGFLLLCAILAVHVSLSSSASFADLDNQLGAYLLPPKSGCRGSIAECSLLAGDEDDTEFLMDSEINRRILAGRRYISYGALRRNTVPCSRRGASYYNCRPGAQANPYRRGCSAITRCRR